MRLKAEAIFVERMNKGDPVLHEFVDYEGLRSLQVQIRIKADCVIVMQEQTTVLRIARTWL